MEKSLNATGELEQMPPEDAAQQHGRAPSRKLPGLHQAPLNSKTENEALTAEHDALCEKLEEEETMFLNEKYSFMSILSQIMQDQVMLLQAVTATTAKQKQYDTQLKEADRRAKEKEKEVRSLGVKLRLQQIKTEKVKKLWEEDCDKKESDFTHEKEAAVASVRAEMSALADENLAIVKQMQTEWEKKHEALEDRLRSELAAKENILKQAEELQKTREDTEEKWLAKEEEWADKESELEEEMQLLMLQNAELHKLASKSDKDKARMRKEEKETKKKSEKRLKEELKVKEREDKREKKKLERERKDKKEWEKREKRDMRRGVRAFFSS